MASRGVTTRREVFLPYNFEPFGLTLVPVRCLLDGARSVDLLDPTKHLVDVAEARFAQLQLELRVTFDRDLLGRIFPPSETTSSPGRILIVARCPATRLRRAFMVTAGPLAATDYTSVVELSRAELRGSVELLAVLVRAAGRSRQPDGFACAAGTKLASARSWELRIDSPRATAGLYLEIRFVSFQTSPPPQCLWPGNLYLLQVGESPVLYLNSDHDAVCAVLNTKATSGERAALREVFFDQISQSVWTRLFLAAASSMDESGEADFDWQQAVLEQFLPALYPDRADHESRVEALEEDLAASQNREELLGRLDGILQTRLELPTHMTRLAQDCE